MLGVERSYKHTVLLAQEELGSPDKWHAAQHKLGDRYVLHKHSYGPLHLATILPSELAARVKHIHRGQRRLDTVVRLQDTNLHILNFHIPPERGPRWEAELRDMQTYMAGAERDATCVVAGAANADMSDAESGATGGQRPALALQAWLRADRIAPVTTDAPTCRAWDESRARRLDYVFASTRTTSLVTAHHHPWGETGKKSDHMAISAE